MPQQIQQQDPFELLGNLMKLKGGMIAIKEGEARIRENDAQTANYQNTLMDNRAIDAALKKWAMKAQQEGRQEIDYDGVLNDLYALGRGGAAFEFRKRHSDFLTAQANRVKSTLDANISKLSFASQMAESINDEASFHLALPAIRDMVGADIAAKFGDKYDPKIVSQLVTMGRTAEQNMTAQRDLYDRMDKMIRWARDAENDTKSWAEKSTKLNDDWTRIASEFLSLPGANAEEWQSRRRVLEQGMGTLPTSLRKSVMDKFDAEFGPESVEKARLLGLSQASRVQERQEDARQAKADQGDISSLTPEALDMEADRFARTGVLPNFGFGTKAVALKTEIINRAVEKYKALDPASQAAAYGANRIALNQMTAQLNAVEAFENTALANLKVALEQVKKVVDTGSPWLNKPIRGLMTDGFGNTEIAAWNAARGVIVPEFARIIQNPRLVGQLTDAGREEIDNLMKSNYTTKQIYDVARILVTDAANRRKMFQQQVDAIKALIAATPQQRGGGPGPVSAIPPANPTMGQQWNSPRGIMTWNGSMWVPGGSE